MLIFFFRWITSKEIDSSSIAQKKRECIELLCLMEKELPTYFFDIQVHLLIHLVDEIEIAGVVSTRWMFWVVLKVDWFNADYKGARATMRQECSGFWSVDSSKPLRVTRKPYILPAHCEQSFFYAAPDSNSPWRQVVPINPRGRRIFDTTYMEADQDSLHKDEPTFTKPL
ncbi:hypothetical protein L7F22_052556 [Adiantum nelumboides]|nr:hypothetical protein [Adiantum nelumboides]